MRQATRTQIEAFKTGAAITGDEVQVMLCELALGGNAVALAACDRAIDDVRAQREAAASKCPHCGNANPKFIEDNGCGEDSRKYGLLCVARVVPKDWAFGDRPTPEADQIGEDGLVACGMQWSPNEEG